MNPTTQTPPATGQSTCTDCGQTYFFESILCLGQELGHLIAPRCPTCCDSAEEAEATRAEAERRAKIQASIEAFLPKDYRETDRNHPKFNLALWSAVRRWRPRDEFWLGIVGPAGQCKTRCMALLAQDAMWAGIRCVWTTANRLVDAVRAERNGHNRAISGAAYEHLQDCLRAPWLFLDDLGKNDWPASFESYFFQLLDHRKAHKLPLIYSSNIHPHGLGLALSDLNREPIIGRLIDRTTLIDLSRQ